MGDHFALLVDRLLTESTLAAAIERSKQLQQAKSSTSEDLGTNLDSYRMDIDIGSLPRKLVECRICHEEDADLNMEMPCSCRGTLKYAHRRCIQRWCNEKGDTTCEICHQQFKPDYIAPPPPFHYEVVPVNSRGNWEISRRELHPPFIGMFSTNRDFSHAEFDDYSAPTSRSLICCRVIAIIFMVLLVLRHTLPIIISGAGDYSVTLLMSVILGTIGILLPIYILVKAFTALKRRRHQRDFRNFSITMSDEENEPPQQQPVPNLIHV